MDMEYGGESAIQQMESEGVAGPPREKWIWSKKEPEPKAEGAQVDAKPRWTTSGGKSRDAHNGSH